MSRLGRLAIVTAIASYALIVLGGITRVASSGTGCGKGWPLCNGRPYPSLEGAAFLEYLHRTLAAGVAVLVVTTALVAWRRPGVSARTSWASLFALGAVVAQGLLGAADARWSFASDVIVLHLSIAMIFFAAVLLTACFAAFDAGRPRWVAEVADWTGEPNRAFVWTSAIGALVMLLLIVNGGLARVSGSGQGCDAWPWCGGRDLVSGADTRTWLDLSHRTAALIGTLAVLIVYWQARRLAVARAARRMSEVALGATVIQLLIGGAYVVTGGSDWLSSAHLASATLVWAALVATASAARGAGATSSDALPAGGIAFSPGSAPALQGAAFASAADLTVGPGGAAAIEAPSLAELALSDLRRSLARVGEYVALTKPGILTLLLATTLGGMLAGAAALPPLGLILATMVGGALAAGGANALNCYIDRDIDALMSRTRKRGTVTGSISPVAALTFGLTLSALSIVILGFGANWLAAGLALAGNIYYVVVYTKFLKRRTPQNIVIGGAAGAMPPVVGWAAATGHVTVTAVLMFALIYYWTPPHFWALALLKQGEYGRAAVPMLPNVRGEEETRWQVLLYTVMLAAVALMMVPFGMGWIYLTGATVLNAIFVAYAIQLYRAPSKALARRMFFYSLWYLALIFAAMVADRMILA